LQDRFTSFSCVLLCSLASTLLTGSPRRASTASKDFRSRCRRRPPAWCVFCPHCGTWLFCLMPSLRSLPNADVCLECILDSHFSLRALQPCRAGSAISLTGQAQCTQCAPGTRDHWHSPARLSRCRVSCSYGLALCLVRLCAFILAVRRSHYFACFRAGTFAPTNTSTSCQQCSPGASLLANVPLAFDMRIVIRCLSPLLTVACCFLVCRLGAAARRLGLVRHVRRRPRHRRARTGAVQEMRLGERV
jgi:hypothetical protein